MTAQDLQSWATRLDAESRLPELVRRLVRAIDANDLEQWLEKAPAVAHGLPEHCTFTQTVS